MALGSLIFIDIISYVEGIKIKLRSVNTLMRKGIGHTAVSTIKVSSVTL